MKKEKSMIAICLSLVFMLSSVLGQIPVPVRADAADYGISSPRTDNGVTTWDCIYLGVAMMRDNIVKNNAATLIYYIENIVCFGCFCRERRKWIFIWQEKLYMQVIL